MVQYDVTDSNYIEMLFKSLDSKGASLKDIDRIVEYLKNYDINEYDPWKLADMMIADRVVKMKKPRASAKKVIAVAVLSLLGLYSVVLPVETRTEEEPYEDFIARSVKHYGQEERVEMNREVNGQLEGKFESSYENWPQLEDLREGDRVTLRKARSIPPIALLTEFLGMGRVIEWPRTSRLRINEREKGRE